LANFLTIKPVEGDLLQEIPESGDPTPVDPALNHYVAHETLQIRHNRDFFVGDALTTFLIGLSYCGLQVEVHDGLVSSTGHHWQ
jgi:hypothetical protein